MKKTTPTNQRDTPRGPKTALDEKFLSVATQVMKSRGITSDRAISLELGRGADFINKVRRGLQSAPPDAWDTLLEKYPEAATIDQSSNTGIAIGTNNNSGTQHYSIAECEKERDSYKSQLEGAQKENELLREQLAMQAALIAAKDETIVLLRGSYNRPN